jgi:hypothetical protein
MHVVRTSSDGEVGTEEVRDATEAEMA